MATALRSEVSPLETERRRFNARVSSATGGSNIELHLGGLDGTVIGTCAVASTGDWGT